MICEILLSKTVELTQRLLIRCAIFAFIQRHYTTVVSLVYQTLSRPVSQLSQLVSLIVTVSAGTPAKAQADICRSRVKIASQYRLASSFTPTFTTPNWINNAAAFVYIFCQFVLCFGGQQCRRGFGVSQLWLFAVRHLCPQR